MSLSRGRGHDERPSSWDFSWKPVRGAGAGVPDKTHDSFLTPRVLGCDPTVYALDARDAAERKATRQGGSLSPCRIG